MTICNAMIISKQNNNEKAVVRIRIFLQNHGLMFFKSTVMKDPVCVSKTYTSKVQYPY